MLTNFCTNIFSFSTKFSLLFLYFVYDIIAEKYRWYKLYYVRWFQKRNFLFPLFLLRPYIFNRTPTITNKYLEKYKIGLGKYILRSTPTLNPPMHKVNYFLWRHCLIIGFDIIILNSGWLNTSAIKVSVCLRLITKSGLFVWPLTSFDFHEITKKL